MGVISRLWRFIRNFLLCCYFCVLPLSNSVTRRLQAAERLTDSSHHSWKFAACVESQKSMPITAVAISPAGSSSANTCEEKHLYRQQLFDLRLDVSFIVDYALCYVESCPSSVTTVERSSSRSEHAL